MSLYLFASYEKPVDTSEDMVKRGIIPNFIPGADIWKQNFLTSPNPFFQELGRRAVIAESWDQYYELSLKAVTEGTYGIYAGDLYEDQEGS